LASKRVVGVWVLSRLEYVLLNEHDFPFRYYL
jgi:hypothetical protein